MPTEDLKRPEQVQVLMNALIALPALMRRIYERGGFEGLEPNAVQVLVAVQASAEISVGELADALALRPATVRHAVGTLQSAKLLQRARITGRAHRFRITAAGGRLVTRFLRSLQEQDRAELIGLGRTSDVRSSR